MLDRIKRWLSPSFPTIAFDGEGQFFEDGAHADIVRKMLERVRIASTVHDHTTKGKLAIDIEHQGVVVRAVSTPKERRSDWADMAVILAVLDEAAEHFEWPWRFSSLPTGDQGVQMAAFPIDTLRRIRASLELSLPPRDIEGTSIHRANESIDVPEEMTIGRDFRPRFLDPLLVVEERTIRLKDEARIDGILVRDRATFDTCGRLSESTLAEDTRVGEFVARKGTKIVLSFGGPEMLTLAKPWKDFPAGTRLELWERTIDRREPVLMEAELPDGTLCEFDEDGTPLSD